MRHLRIQIKNEVSLQFSFLTQRMRDDFTDDIMGKHLIYRIEPVLPAFSVMFYQYFLTRQGASTRPPQPSTPTSMSS